MEVPARADQVLGAPGYLASPGHAGLRLAVEIECWGKQQHSLNATNRNPLNKKSPEDDPFELFNQPFLVLASTPSERETVLRRSASCSQRRMTNDE